MGGVKGPRSWSSESRDPRSWSPGCQVLGPGVLGPGSQLLESCVLGTVTSHPVVPGPGLGSWSPGLRILGHGWSQRSQILEF